MLSDVARAVRAVASYLLGLLRPGSKTSLVRSDVVSAAGEYLLLPGHRIRVANLATMFFLFFGGGLPAWIWTIHFWNWEWTLAYIGNFDGIAMNRSRMVRGYMFRPSSDHCSRRRCTRHVLSYLINATQVSACLFLTACVTVLTCGPYMNTTCF